MLRLQSLDEFSNKEIECIDDLAVCLGMSARGVADTDEKTTAREKTAAAVDMSESNNNSQGNRGGALSRVLRQLSYHPGRRRGETELTSVRPPASWGTYDQRFEELKLSLKTCPKIKSVIYISLHTYDIHAYVHTYVHVYIWIYVCSLDS